MNSWIRSFSGLRFFIVLFLVLHHWDVFNDLNLPGWNALMKVLSEHSSSCFQDLLFNIVTANEFLATLFQEQGSCAIGWHIYILRTYSAC